MGRNFTWEHMQTNANRTRTDNFKEQLHAIQSKQNGSVQCNK